jgi:hypothetical protein
MEITESSASVSSVRPNGSPCIDMDWQKNRSFNEFKADSFGILNVLSIVFQTHLVYYLMLPKPSNL